MTKIRAVVVDPSVPDWLTLQTVDSPAPAPSEALVRVAAVSLNLGEIRRVTQAEAGTRPGWDLAGVVEQAAADGSGPAAGTRVVGFVPAGAWAELVSVPTHALATLPDNVSFAQASTLPVAGLTALYAVERGCGLIGRTVLVTGASGGVGVFACQLAHISGATVVALIRNPSYVPLVKAVQANQIIVSEDAEAARPAGPYRLIIESVGSQVLGTALSMLAPDGVCVSLGVSAGCETTLDIRTLMTTGRASLYGFYLFRELEREPATIGLARLAYLVSVHRLRPHISLEAQWEEIGPTARKLWERHVSGKAVLHVAQL